MKSCKFRVPTTWGASFDYSSGHLKHAVTDLNLFVQKSLRDLGQYFILRAATLRTRPEAKLYLG